MAVIKPTTKKVASYIRTRTRTKGGVLAEDFNDDTTPKGTVVEGMIDEQVEWLEGQAYPCDEQPKLEKQFEALVALLTAMEIESTFWPDQVGTEKSNYDQLKERYDQRIKLYTEGVEERCPEGEEGGEGTEGSGAHQLAQGGFPDASGFQDMRF